MAGDMEMAAHLRGNDSLAQVVNTSPPHQQQQRQEITVAQISPDAVDEIIGRYKKFPKSASDELDEFRGWLMVLNTLTASMTWNAALNPPGGVWQADDAANGYVAGSSVFRDKNIVRYHLFETFNNLGFYSSLLILVLLSINWVFRKIHIMVINILVSTDLVSLYATFFLGSSVNKKDSPLTIPLMVAYTLFVIVYLTWLMRKPRV